MLASIPPAYVAPFERAWRHRELIRAVVRREFISRFRGSLLGPAWAVLSPLIMLLTYTVLFSITVPQLSAGMSVTEYASGIFIGLIVFNLFSETWQARIDAGKGDAISSGTELCILENAVDPVTSDPTQTLRSWAVVVNYLLRDYRFIHE